MTKLLLISATDEKRAMDMALQPLGLAYIASYLRENVNLKNIQIVTKNAEIEHAMSVFKPDIVGISSVTQNYNLAAKISNYIKQELDIPVIIGGHHITALPNNLDQSMDIGVLGEGEQTMLELIETFEQNGLNINELNKIDGIVFRDRNKLKITNNRKLIEPLDIIPFPARDLLNELISKV